MTLYAVLHPLHKCAQLQDQLPHDHGNCLLLPPPPRLLLGHTRPPPHPSRIRVPRRGLHDRGRRVREGGRHAAHVRALQGRAARRDLPDERRGPLRARGRQARAGVLRRHGARRGRAARQRLPPRRREGRLRVLRGVVRRGDGHHGPRRRRAGRVPVHGRGSWDGVQGRRRAGGGVQGPRHEAAGVAALRPEPGRPELGRARLLPRQIAGRSVISNN